MMVDEYTYFRAEGASLVAAQTVAKSRARVTSIHRALCARFGADDIFTGRDEGAGEQAAPRLYCLVFGKGKAPAGWDHSPEVARNDFGDYLLPPEGSSDRMHLDFQLGLAAAAARKSTLEAVFDCAPMPRRHLEPGIYSNAFVRRRTWIYEWTGVSSRVPAQDEGKLRGEGFVSGSNNGVSFPERLEMMELCGDYYIRVPNGRDGAPLFTPPDARRMEYREMIMLDAREHARRHPPLRPPSIH